MRFETMVLLDDPEISMPLSVFPEITFATEKLVAVEGVVPILLPVDVEAI